MGWRAALLCLGLALSLSAAAQVYRWVDADGNVHFGDQPHQGAQKVPAEGRDAAAPAADSEAYEAERAARRQRLLDSMEADRRAREAAAAKAEREAGMRTRNCRVARSNLQGIRQAGSLYSFDAKGQRHVFSDAERAKATRDAEAAVAKWCDPEE